MNHHHEESGLTFKEKMVKLIEHWIKHNEDHAATYSQWADRAKEEGLQDVAGVLEDIAQDTMKINEKFGKINVDT